jgi:hypothetical protein
MNNTVPFTHQSIPHPNGLHIFLSQANTVIYYGCSLCNYQHQDWRNLVQHAKGSKHGIAFANWRQRQQDDMNIDTQEAHQSVTNNDVSTVRSDNMSFPDILSMMNSIVPITHRDIPNPLGLYISRSQPNNTDMYYGCMQLPKSRC